MKLKNISGKKRLGVEAALGFDWYFTKLCAHLAATNILPFDKCFKQWNEREEQDVVRASIKNQHELGWAKKEHKQPLYLQSDLESDTNTMMEHTIPVWQWTTILIGLYKKKSDLFKTAYFLAWTSPIAQINISSNDGLSEKNYNPKLPFHRYSGHNKQINIVFNDGSDLCPSSWSFDKHFELISKLPHVRPVLDKHQIYLTHDVYEEIIKDLKNAPEPKRGLK